VWVWLMVIMLGGWSWSNNIGDSVSNPQTSNQPVKPNARCVGPMLTIAAARAHGRAVFVSPPDKRAEAEAARRTLAPAAYDYRSDHLALVAAFAGWEAARRKGGRRAAAEFSARSFVSDQVGGGCLCFPTR